MRRCFPSPLPPAGSYVVYNDRHCPDAVTAHFCERCYSLFHTAAGGEALVYNDYDVFPYFHDYVCEK